MKPINHKCIIPSAACTITPSMVKFYCSLDKTPEPGDLVYGKIASLGRHLTLESKSARIHTIQGGKSHAAAACCYALSSAGKKVRGAKITGTASLKDLLLMEDCGADRVADFTYLGHPSTYMLDREDLTGIFNVINLKYGNAPVNYLVVELADGILQRETRMLLESEDIRSRIHKLVFCGNDAFGILGGIRLLKDVFGLVSDAISGVCTSSPLHLRECREFINLPVLKSADADHKSIYHIIQ